MTLAIPAPRLTDTAPSWTPRPGFVELITATAWVRPCEDEFDVIVLTHSDDDGGQPALASGVLSKFLVQLADYWIANTGELRSLIDAGLLTLTDIGPEDPALAYAEAHAAELGGKTRPESWAALGLAPACVLAPAEDSAVPHFDEDDLPF